MISLAEFLYVLHLFVLCFFLPSFLHVMIITISSSLSPSSNQPAANLVAASQSLSRSVGRFIVIARVLSAPLIFSLSFFLVRGVALTFPARASIVRALTRPVLLILPSPSSAPVRPPASVPI